MLSCILVSTLSHSYFYNNQGPQWRLQQQQKQKPEQPEHLQHPQQPEQQHQQQHRQQQQEQQRHQEQHEQQQQQQHKQQQQQQQKLTLFFYHICYVIDLISLQLGTWYALSSVVSLLTAPPQSLMECTCTRYAPPCLMYFKLCTMQFAQHTSNITHHLSPITHHTTVNVGLQAPITTNRLFDVVPLLLRGMPFV